VAETQCTPTGTVCWKKTGSILWLGCRFYVRIPGRML